MGGKIQMVQLKASKSCGPFLQARSIENATSRDMISKGVNLPPDKKQLNFSAGHDATSQRYL
jgi:hypothetical protein